jgi:casein kinase II subunit alpha
MLKTLKHPNILKFKDAVRDPLTKTASFILELVHNEEYKTLFPKFTYEDIRFYMKELFKTLDYIHSNGVMHRDIKPHNILIDHAHKTLKVIDFSLAELYYPEKEYSTRVSSLYYKAPELLLGNVFYDYRVDIWSAGVILAGLVDFK